MRPADTSPEAHAVQVALWRRIGPERRLALAIEMSDELRAVCRDGIRSRHPDYTDDQVRLALFRLTLGDALFRAAWPDAPLLAP